MKKGIIAAFVALILLGGGAFAAIGIVNNSDDSEDTSEQSSQAAEQTDTDATEDATDADEAADMTTEALDSQDVEISLLDELDGVINSYCLDIAGGNTDIDPANGLQAHTCYSPSGEVLVDQAFDPDQFADGVLYMPEFDVCVQAPSTEAGAAFELAACDGSDAQSWAFDGEGTIAPASATDMCMTLTGETRTGRSDENQMIALTLEACSDDLAATQTWSNRTAE